MGKIEVTVNMYLVGDFNVSIGNNVRGNRGYGDFNGDGMIDLVYEAEMDSDNIRVILNNAKTPDLLTHITNETGGETSIYYDSTAKLTGAILPTVRSCEGSNTTIIIKDAELLSLCPDRL